MAWPELPPDKRQHSARSLATGGKYIVFNMVDQTLSPSRYRLSRDTVPYKFHTSIRVRAGRYGPAQAAIGITRPGPYDAVFCGQRF